ncbi:MAG: hypothetical protein K2Q14_03360 [Gammaproteobacteria bacterium]|nr:hypothetical protein [Gammaproteobacteria bacterium]
MTDSNKLADCIKGLGNCIPNCLGNPTLCIWAIFFCAVVLCILFDVLCHLFSKLCDVNNICIIAPTIVLISALIIASTNMFIFGLSRPLVSKADRAEQSESEQEENENLLINSDDERQKTLLTKSCLSSKKSCAPYCCQFIFYGVVAFVLGLGCDLAIEEFINNERLEKILDLFDASALLASIIFIKILIKKHSAFIVPPLKGCMKGCGATFFQLADSVSKSVSNCCKPCIPSNSKTYNR